MISTQETSREVLTFEQLNLGDRWQSELRTIGQSEINAFADLTGDHDRLHTDPDYASRGPFGQPIAHGMLGMSVLIGLSSHAPQVQTSAFVDIRNWSFCKPIYPGDTVFAITEIVDLKTHGRRHGEVHWHRQLFNQRGEKVQEGILVTLVARKNPLTSKQLRSDTPHSTKQPANPPVSSDAPSHSKGLLELTTAEISPDLVV